MYFDLNSVVSDKQGRISLPVTLFKTGRITRGGALCIYPIESYWIACDVQRLQDIVLENFPGSSIDPEVRAVRREFMVDVKTLHIDPQGRIQFKSIDTSLPGTEYVVVGTGLEFEIWPLAVWRQNNDRMGGNDEV